MRSCCSARPASSARTCGPRCSRTTRVSALDCPGRDRVDLLAGGPPARSAALLRARAAGRGRAAAPAGSAAAATTWCGPTRSGHREAHRGGGAGRARRAAGPARLGRASTASVPHGRAVREDDPAPPVSEYGVSHLAATRLLELASAAGPGRRRDAAGVQPDRPGLTEDEPARPRGRPAARGARRPGWDDDHAGRRCRRTGTSSTCGTWPTAVVAGGRRRRGLRAAGGQRRQRPGGAGRGWRCELLADVAGFRGEIREEGAGPARSAAVDWMLADIGRAAATLGWAPAHDLADSVGRRVDAVGAGRGREPTPWPAQRSAGDRRVPSGERLPGRRLRRAAGRRRRSRRSAVAPGCAAASARRRRPPPPAGAPRVDAARPGRRRCQLGLPAAGLPGRPARRAGPRPAPARRHRPGPGRAARTTSPPPRSPRCARSGKRVLAYFEIGSIEDFRPEYAALRRGRRT